MSRLRGQFLAALGACLILGGCRGDAPTLPCPPSGLGFVEGFVTAGGEPVQTVVELTRPSSIKYPHPEAEAWCATDSAGWYSIEAPQGKYFLYAGSIAYGKDGPVWSGEPDTIRVGTGRTRTDLPLGSLTLDLDADPALNGRELLLGWFCPSGRLGYQTAVVTDGRIQVRFLPLVPDHYLVSWYLGSSYPRAGPWLPGTWNRDEAAVFEVSSDAVTLHAGAILEPWILEGSITGSWQELRLDPPLVDGYAAENTKVLTAVVQADGSYRMEVPIARPVRLLVRSSGMERWAGGSDFSTATPYQGSPGETVSGPSYVEGGIECSLEPEAFPDHSSGTLALYDAGRRQLAPGYFHPARRNPAPIPNLEPGIYFLHYSPDYPEQFLAQWYDRADSASATPIEVLPGGAVTRITLRIQSREAGR